MYRAGKASKQLPLEARYSDPLEVEGSGSAVEWEREPILNLVTAVLGAGVLGFPFCFRTCGLGLALLLVLVNLAAAELSMRLLLISSQLTSKRSYEDLARHSFGRVGQWAVDSCIVAMNVGSVVAYLNILTDTISSVAGTVIPPGAEPSRNLMLGLVTMAGVLPVALFVRSAQLLNAVNALSMVFLLFFCCIIALLPFSPMPNSGSLQWWRWEGVLVAFPIVSYGFTAHQYLFQIYPASQRPSMRKMTTAVQRGMLLSAAIYVVVGACGYGAFGERTSGDVLRNLGASFGGLGARGVRLQAERVLKYGFGVSLLGVIPLTVIPLHTTFAPWLGLCSPAFRAAAKQAESAGLSLSSMTLSHVQESALTTAILGGSCAMAVLLPNVEFVFGLAGSTASTLMAFILPAAIFLKVTSGQRGLLGHSVDMLRGTPAWRQRRRMAGALLLFGCVAGVLCTQALVVSIREEHEVVQLAQELVREETKVAVAAQTEAKAKQVAEVVEAVAKAAQEVESAQEEATGHAEKLAMAAQALNSTGSGRKERQQQRAATSELQRASGDVDKTLEKLENVTAVLTSSANRMRNETAAAKGSSPGEGAIDEAIARAAAAQQQLQQLQQQHEVHMQGQGSEQGSQQQQKEQRQQQEQQEQQEQQQQQQQQAGAFDAGGAHDDGAGVDTSSDSSDDSDDSNGAGSGSRGSDRDSSAGTTSSSSAGSAAHAGVVRAAEAAVATLHSAVHKTAEAGKTGDEDAADVLAKVASTANDTLAAVKQSKVALEAAAAEAATSGKNRTKKRDDLDKAITQALNATAEVAARLNATAEALKAVGQEKTSELLTMVAKLAEEDGREEAKEVRQAAEEEAQRQLSVGRKVGVGFAAVTTDGSGGSGEAAGSSAGGVTSPGAAGGGAPGGAGSVAAVGGRNATVNGTAAGAGKPRQEVREALKQAAAVAAAAEAANLTALVNVTQMAQAAIDAASSVVASSKASVEQAIERKKPKVTVRAIEIAKELHAGGAGGGAGTTAPANTSSTTGGTSGTGSSSSGSGKIVSAIEVAQEKHEEIASRQQQGRSPSVVDQSAAAFNSTPAVAAAAAAAQGGGDSGASSTATGSLAATAAQG